LLRVFCVTHAVIDWRAPIAKKILKYLQSIVGLRDGTLIN
jgi:hypothetical protein